MSHSEWWVVVLQLGRSSFVAGLLSFEAVLVNCKRATVPVWILIVCAVPDMIMASTAKTLGVKASKVAQVGQDIYS